MRTKRTWGAILAGGVLTLALAGPAPADIQRVKAVDGDKFKPVHKYIGKGDTVKWRNRDNVGHNVVSTSTNWAYSAELAPGATTKKRFRKRGTFAYRCTYHSGIVDGKCQGMCGFVHVVGG